MAESGSILEFTGMAELTSRERVQLALSRRTPDRIPVDFGSTFVSGIHVSEWRRCAGISDSTPAP
jgi:hypothetical protein